MNKVILIALVAFAAAMVTAQDIPELDIEDFEQDSELSIAPTDDNELAALTGKMQIFSSFCINSRDHVIGDLQRTTRGLVANIFKLFFQSAEEIGLNAINTERSASETLTNQLRNPSAPVDSENPIVADAQKKIQENDSNSAKSFVQAITAAISASGTSIAQSVSNKLKELQQTLNVQKLGEAIESVCDKVAVYEQDIKEQFEESKKDVVSRDPTMKTTTVDQVNCVTSKRIQRLEGICKFARVAKNPLMKILTYRQ